MSNNRQTAVNLLNEAAVLIGRERAGHGSVEESFTMIAELWSTYITHAIAHRSGVGRPIPEIHLTARDVAMMMTDVKKARATYGDEENPDNYVDVAGYTALAGMLSTRVEDSTGNALVDAMESEEPIPAFLNKKDGKSDV